MIRVCVVGAAGRMGGHVLRALEADSEWEVAAAIDRPDHPDQGKEVSPGIALCAEFGPALERADVAIDFSQPSATLALLRVIQTRAKPLVIATTGFDRAELAEIRAAAESAPIAMSANFSLGIAVLVPLVEEAARRLPDYEIEVLEMHHNRKVDAPSGTALRLGEAAARARGHSLAELARYQREGLTGPRPPQEIGLQALRAGEVVGEHTVFLVGPGERLELTHRASSRDNFVRGALQAARFVLGRPPGLYTMEDILREGLAPSAP